MKRKITVTVPHNLQPHERPLFEPYVTYTIPQLKVKMVKKPFITNSGLVVNRQGLMKESYHYLFPRQYQERLAEVGHHYHFVQKDADNLIILDDDEIYLLIHNSWHNNYYHWMSETIFRLWMVKDKAERMTLLLPSKTQLSEYVEHSLAPFRFKDVFYIPEGKSLLVNNLCMPQIKPFMAFYVPVAQFDLKKIYIDYVQKQNDLRLDLGERIYLSRKKSHRRHFSNESEVLSVLKEFGFTTIYNEDYTFFEQVAIYSNAKILVSAHGSGLFNMLFMKQNSIVLELHKQKTNNTDQHSLIFWYLASILGYKYYHQLCEPTDCNENFYDADFIVDIATLKSNVENIIQI